MHACMQLFLVIKIQAANINNINKIATEILTGQNLFKMLKYWSACDKAAINLYWPICDFYYIKKKVKLGEIQIYVAP